MKFSQRIGKKPIRTELQIESMDNELRVALWNAFQLFFLEEVRNANISKSGYDVFFKILWLNFFKLPLDNMNDYFPNTYEKIREWFYEWEWFEVYDFIEFISQVESPTDSKAFKEFCNNALEKEMSGYRFINDNIVEITDEKELQEIESAIENSKKDELTGVKIHLETALKLLADRKLPDYRNSIKESISAVESISQIISGNPKAELSDALKVLETKISLHGALKRGFIAIYGYTSDADGIRHALTDESSVDFVDAKYMLVSCSAFINYLKMKSEKASIEL